MSRYTTVIPTSGPSGNIFVIVGRASSLLRQLGHSREEISAFQSRVNESQSYDAACRIVEEYFPLDRDDD